MLLEFIREEYDADIAAIFLIVKEMHEDEKLFWFEKRLKYIERRYEEENIEMPGILKKYWGEYSRGGKESLKPYLNDIDILKFCFKETQKEIPSCPIDARIEPKERLWKYTYKKRPSQWVIFKEHKESNGEKAILNEGLTAYAVRTKQNILIPESLKMDKCCCITHLNAESGITPKCKMVAFFPLISEESEIIGLVKIENYTDIPERYDWFDVSTQVGKSKCELIQRKYLPLLVKFIEKSKEFSKEFSYEELYGVSPRLFLEQFKKLQQPKTDMQKRILEKTEHLLWVLERKEYVGHKEIMIRITKYADDIADDLGVSKPEFFQRLLDERKKHEELMLYETYRYRDHFMHSFHVFLMGYIILNHIGLDKVCDMIKKNLQYAPSPYKQMNLDNDAIIRIWFLTSFLHDAAYVFEKFNEGMANFTKNEWGYSLKGLSNMQQFLDLGDKDMPLGKYLGKMLEFFGAKNEINRSEMLSHYLHSVKMNDHGVLSALWLLGKFENGSTLSRDLENYLSALAISFHNPIIFKNVKEGGQFRVTFESFPILFLLVFCDTAQNWGRRTMAEDYVKTQLVKIDLLQKQIKLTLFYATPFHNKLPHSIDVQDKEKIFKSADYEFGIDYNGGEEWDNPHTPFIEIDKKFFH